MSDEEKKALERIDYIQDFIIENGQYNADVNDMQYFSIVLNLIEKQQKEIEELKEKNKFLNWYFDNQKENFIHKDKIKAEIAELEKEKEENADEIKKNLRFYSIYDSYNLQINILQSLLEKE